MAPTETPTPARHAILLVDDQQHAREGFAALLSLHRCDVTLAASASEGLRQLHDGLRPCLILLDLHMPRVDGWAFREWAAADAALATIPIVIVSGDPSQAVRAGAAGVVQFLVKPVEPAQLIDAVERHCRTHPAP